MTTSLPNFPCPPQAVIFDMDGLLVDSERLWKVAETEWLASYGREYSEQKHAPYIGMALGQFIPNLQRVYEVETDVDTMRRDLLVLVLDIVSRETVPQPGAREMVRFVVENGIPHAIASSSPMDVIHATINSQAEWAQEFAIRCSGDEVPHGKPAPDVYLLAAERLGVDPTQCIALEDSRNGSRAAVAAGMTCFAVPDTSHAKPEEFAEITPFVFPTLHEALALLRGCYVG